MSFPTRREIFPASRARSFGLMLIGAGLFLLGIVALILLHNWKNT
jgi:hypothetical protein